MHSLWQKWKGAHFDIVCGPSAKPSTFLQRQGNRFMDRLELRFAIRRNPNRDTSFVRSNVFLYGTF